MTPLPAAVALDAYFLEARARLLDLAAIYDRIDRGSDARTAASDPRYARLRQALAMLQRPEPGRAELVQQLFSLEYDGSWKRPVPR